MLQTNSRPDQTSRVQNCPQVNLRYPKTLYQKHLLPRSMSLTLLLTPSEFFVGTFLPALHPDMLNLSSGGQNSNTECVEPGKLKELPPPFGSSDEAILQRTLLSRNTRLMRKPPVNAAL
jgi:hypothetical protein